MSKAITLSEWKTQVEEAKAANMKRKAQQFVADATVVNETPAEAPATMVPEVSAPTEDTNQISASDESTVPETAVEESPATDNVAEVETSTEEEVSQDTPDNEPVAAPVAPAEDDTTVKASSEMDKLRETLGNMLKNADAGTIVYGRVGKRGKQFKGIVAPELKSFMQTVLTTGEPPAEFSIACDVHPKTHSIALWEEGGAYLETGTALIITDPYGNAKDPKVAYNNKNVCNGRHALLRLDLYDHIIVGVRSGSTKAVAIYRVNTITPVINNSATAICSCIVSISPRDEERDDILIKQDLKDYERTWICAQDSESDGVSDKLDHVLGLIDATLYDTEVCKPIYTNRYGNTRRNIESLKRDYINYIKNPLPEVKSFDTLSSMYEYFDTASEVFFTEFNPRNEDLVAILTLNRVVGNSGTAYLKVNMNYFIYPNLNVDANTLNPNVTYPQWFMAIGGVILKESDTFYYPDTDGRDANKCTSCASIIAELHAHGNCTRLAALKRLC